MKYHTKKIVITITALCCCYFAAAQTKRIDSLKKMLPYKNGRDQLALYLQLCLNQRSLHPDTTLLFASNAEKMAAAFNNKTDQLWASLYMGIALSKKGNYDTAKIIAETGLQQLKLTDQNIPLQAEFIFLKANAYMRQSLYKEAMDEFLNVLRIAENSRDIFNQVKAMSGAGWVNMELGKYTEALQWFRRCINADPSGEYANQFATLFANMASTFNNISQYDSAFYYSKKARAASEKNEELGTLANILNIEADIYINTKNISAAEVNLEKALAIRKKIGDAFYIVADMAQLAGFYAENKETEKGVAIAKEAAALAIKEKLVSKLPYIFEMLAMNYKNAGDYKNYSIVQEQLLHLKDSLYEKNSAEALAAIEKKYELQKKESIITRQQFDLTVKNYWLYGSFIFGGFILLILYLLFIGYRRRQRMKTAMAIAEEKIHLQAAVKEAEESERRRIAADLHDNLGAYAASIMANIDTLSREEQVSLRSAKALRELRNNSRSIVSQLGDTIWALKRNALSFTTVSDRIKLVFQKLQPSYPDIQFDVTERISEDRQFPPAMAFHIYQITQEAIINAVKHSDCHQLLVIFTGTKTTWEIRVEDDGKGMPGNSLKEIGNGLHNMKTRAQEAGVMIEWESNNPTGTIVRILPTAN